MEIKIVKKVLEAHEKLAEEIRELLAGKGAYMFNLIGGPGAGKTLLLESTFDAAAADIRPGVIEGDIATTADAERLQRFDVPVVHEKAGFVVKNRIRQPGTVAADNRHAARVGLHDGQPPALLGARVHKNVAPVQHGDHFLRIDATRKIHRIGKPRVSRQFL